MSLIEMLFKQKPSWSNYLLAITIVTLFCIYLFPLAFLEGKGGIFQIGDFPQHVSGWYYYVHDKWYFPLGYTRNLNYPVGANITLTDSIPLSAFF